MKLAFGIFAIVLVLLVFVLGSILLMVPLSVLTGNASQGTGGPPPAGAVYGGDNLVTLAAKQMVAHLNSDCLKIDPNPDCVGDASFDTGFPSTILNWGLSHCPGCLAWMNNHFQCVSFVLGAYGLFHPLDLSGNGSDFYGLYSTPSAASLGYHEQLPARGELPISPGDVMAWNGGAHGHVSIVLGWVPPTTNQNGMITFAQANGEKPVQTLPILPDGHVDTNDGYWNGFTVMAYIHPSWLPVVSGSLTQSTAQTLPAGLSMNTAYVAEAWNDAIEAGIPPGYYVRQIKQESGFNPNARSPVGAEGIAQFMPSTAAGIPNPLGTGVLNPFDPHQALIAGARYMAAAVQRYGGDYAKALAAYNGGDGEVQAAEEAAVSAKNRSTWLDFLSLETRQYLTVIMGI